MQKLPASYCFLLTRLAKQICELGSLEALDLSRNKIEKLPDRPGKLKRLQILIVNRNRLRRLPSWISQSAHA